METIIETERLILRKWKDEDVEPFTRINQDPLVIEFLRGPMTREEAQNFIIWANEQIDCNGFGLWATTLKDTGELIGFIGLNRPNFTASFTPCVEIAWRLDSNHWGKGYATEGARAVLKFGFEKVHLNEIVAFTVPANKRSLRVMEKLGMQQDMNGTFQHPRLPLDHPLSCHVLYRIKASDL